MQKFKLLRGKFDFKNIANFCLTASVKSNEGIHKGRNEGFHVVTV
jgi:hypothetical protein